MDAAQVLEEYLADIPNLPSDLAYVLEELDAKDETYRDAQKRVLARDGAIQKYIKAHGSLSENPKESSLYPQIRADFQKSVAIQKEKYALANTGLYIISRHVKKLNDQIKVLEEEGLLMPVTIDDHEEPSPEPPQPVSRRISEQKRPLPPSRDKTPIHPQRPVKRQKTEPLPRSARPMKTEGDETYCFCQQGSFGNMVACDHPDCQYEWFHYECVGITEAPTGTWYCPPCVERSGGP